MSDTLLAGLLQMPTQTSVGKSKWSHEIARLVVPVTLCLVHLSAHCENEISLKMPNETKCCKIFPDSLLISLLLSHLQTPAAKFPFPSLTSSLSHTHIHTYTHTHTHTHTHHHFVIPYKANSSFRVPNLHQITI